MPRIISLSKRLIQLGLSPELLQEVPDDYPDAFSDSILGHLEQSLRYELKDSNLLNSIFYFHDGENIQFFQFYIEPSTDKKITLGNNSSLTFKVAQAEQRNPHKSGLKFHAFSSIDINLLSASWKEDARTLGVKPCDFSDNKNEQIENNAKLMEEFLLEKFDEIKEVVKQKGYWTVPVAVSQQYPQFEVKAPQDSKQSELNAQFFNNNEVLLEKFCYFKIKELIAYAKNPDGKIKPTNDVCLSVIEQNGAVFKISEVDLVFSDSSNVVSIKNIHSSQAPNVIQALRQSGWLLEQSEKTCIRLSNQFLEDSLVVKYTCHDLKYGILSSKFKLSGSKTKKLNFWEALAENIKSHQEKDDSQMELVHARFNALAAKRKPLPSLHPDVSAVASVNSGKKQIEFANKIRQNQSEIRGTLLHLPTGYGKTYILLMAMAQHHRLCTVKKPYLVVVPKNNVRSSWLNNVKDLNHPSESRAPAFEKECDIYNCDEGWKLEKASAPGSNHHIILVTPVMLKNHIDSLLNPIPGQKKTSTGKKRKSENEQDADADADAGSDSEDNNDVNLNQTFIKCLHAAGYIKLSLVLEIYSTLKPKLFSKHDYVVGESSNWQRSITEVLSLPIVEQGVATRKQTKKIIPSEIPFIVAELTKLQGLQLQQILKYDEFKSRFNGIILDESHELIVEQSNGEKIKPTDVLMDIAKTYQAVAKQGVETNPLTVASSATPWPNEMDELKQHFQFLYPRLIGEFKSLNDALFSKWNAFESFLETCDEDNVNNSEKLKDHVSFVQNRFHRWVRILFENAVQHERPSVANTSRAKPQVMYINCKAENTINTVEKIEIVSFNRLFYSSILGVSAQKKLNYPNGISSDLYQKIVANLPDMRNKPKKIAFFVFGTEDAMSFAKRLSDHYKEHGDNFIGFFYNERFIKKDKGDKHDEYANITYNTNKDVNINTFNNIYKFSDFIRFLGQFFYVENHSLLDNNNTFKNRFQVVLNLFDAPSTDKLKATKKVLEKSKYADMHDIYKSCIKYITYKLSSPNEDVLSSGDFTAQEKSQLLFFQNLKELEDRSRKSLILDFEVELQTFSKFLVEFGTESDLKEKYKKIYALSIQAVIKLKKGKQVEWVNNPFVLFRILTLAYLYKIYRSNILIFGVAGAAGMRIDADELTILSGVWNEGRQTQIEGRVSRAKGKNGAFKPCIIRLPLTNATFEFGILKYFIKKSVYNVLITSSARLTNEKLFLPLWLSAQLGLYHQKLISENHIIDNSIHQKVRAEIRSTSEETYLRMDSYQKALTFLPANLHTRLIQFGQLLQSIGPIPIIEPDNAMQQDIQPAANDNNIGLWDDFSQWIKVYAKRNGWEESPSKQLEPRSMIEALSPKLSFLLTASIPTNMPSDDDDEGVEQNQFLKKTISNILPIVFSSKQNSKHVINNKSLEANLLQQICAENTIGNNAIFANSSCDWSGFRMDEFYVEIICQDPGAIAQVNCEEILLNNRRYIPVAYILGGRDPANFQLMTYRLTSKGYTQFDANSTIRFHSHLPILNGELRFIRYVRQDLLSDVLPLQALQLKNDLENSYVHASYQFVETEELHRKIRQLMVELKNIPNFNMDNLTLASEIKKVRKPTFIPQIIPQPSPIPDSVEQYAGFVREAKSILILTIPSLGRGGDIPAEEFVARLNSLLNNAQIKSYKTKIFLVYGLNIEQKKKDELTAHLTTLRLQSTANVQIILRPFLWRSEDIWVIPRKNKQGENNDKKILPFGQMRNYCLQESQALWNKLLKLDPKLKNIISCISMDGDTLIPPQCLYRMGVLRSDSYIIGTRGYEMGNEFLNEHTLDLPTPKQSDLTTWQDYWKRLACRIHMDVNQQLLYKTENGQRYYGYMSEPMIFLTPQLTATLFSSTIDIGNRKKAPFGYWDGEGRHLLKYVGRLLASDSPPLNYDSYGPSIPEERALLMNYGRFEVKLSLYRIKQQLTKEELAMVITAIYKQPQNILRPYIIGSNISSAFAIKAGPIRYFASYFYIKSFLLLLALGPKRSFEFSKLILDLYTAISEDDNSPEFDQDIWGVDEEIFVEFVAKNFMLQVAAQTDDSVGNHTKLFAPLLAKWAMAISHQLRTWFTDDYQGERDLKNNRYIPILFPKNYPSKAIQSANDDLLESDIQSEDKRHFILNKLLQYLVNSILFERSTHPRFKSIRTEYAPFLSDLGRDDYGNLLVIMVADNKLDDNFYEKISTDLKKCCKTPIIFITIQKKNDSYCLVFTYYENEKMVHKAQIDKQTAEHEYFQFDTFRKEFSGYILPFDLPTAPQRLPGFFKSNTSSAAATNSHKRTNEQMGGDKPLQLAKKAVN